MFHQRLWIKKKGKKKFRAVKTSTDRNQKSSRITSSKAGVIELPAMLNSPPSSILALFGEEARGLVAGVDL
jgi:CII-binding regulator of phage lambda lysogenization HflD